MLGRLICFLKGGHEDRLEYDREEDVPAIRVVCDRCGRHGRWVEFPVNQKQESGINGSSRTA